MKENRLFPKITIDTAERQTTPGRDDRLVQSISERTAARLKSTPTDGISLFLRVGTTSAPCCCCCCLWRHITVQSPEGGRVSVATCRARVRLGSQRKQRRRMSRGPAMAARTGLAGRLGPDPEAVEGGLW